MSGKIRKSQSAKATASSQKIITSDDAPSRIVIGTGKSEAAAAATNTNGGGESFIRDLPPPSQMVQPRGAALALLSGNLSAAMPSTADSNEANNSASGNRFAIFSQLEHPLPMIHSYSLPSLPSTLLQPRMTSSVEVDEGEGATNDASNTSRDLSKGDQHYPPTAPLPLLSRTLSTPESSSSSRSVFGRAGSAFGRFSTAGSRANSYTQSDPGLSAFHPVSFSHQRSFGSGGSSSLVGSEIIEEHDDGSGLKTSARASTVPSNNKTRGFLMKAREKLETTKLQSTKRRSGRENPARPSLNDTDDVSSPPTTIITNNDDGVEISIVTEGKTAPPEIERVSPPSKVKASKSSKKEKLVKPSIIPHAGQHHDDPGLELDISDDSDDDDESIDEVEQLPGVEVSLKPQSNRPPSRASNRSKAPFDENAQTYTHTATNVKTSANGVAAKFKFKSPQRRSKMMSSPSSHVASASPHQSPSAGTTSSSSKGSPDSRGGLSTISSNSNSISSAANIRGKINSAASSPGGTDSCAKESMGSSTTNSEVRDIVRQNPQKKNIRNLRSTGKDGQPEESETASVDMDIISASADSGNSVCMREGAINPHIALSNIPGGTPSVSPHRLPESVHEAPFDERSRGSPEVGKIIDSKVSKIITFNSKRESQSPHSADAHTTSSASASNASVSNATSTSSGGGSQQPVKFVAYERVEEREESPFDEHPHDESRIATPQNVIRPTITNGGNNALGQRPPTSPRKTMGRMTTPPPHVHTALAGFKTPASPPTIADRHVVVRDIGAVESGSRSHIPKPKSNRMKMILVNPNVVSPERLHSQANVAIDSRQQGGSELNSAIVSPEKVS